MKHIPTARFSSSLAHIEPGWVCYYVTTLSPSPFLVGCLMIKKIDISLLCNLIAGSIRQLLMQTRWAKWIVEWMGEAILSIIFKLMSQRGNIYRLKYATEDILFFLFLSFSCPSKIDFLHLKLRFTCTIRSHSRPHVRWKSQLSLQIAVNWIKRLNFQPLFLLVSRRISQGKLTWSRCEKRKFSDCRCVGSRERE